MSTFIAAKIVDKAQTATGLDEFTSERSNEETGRKCIKGKDENLVSS
ncbi:MAG: hypothetical protein HDR34_00320 [Treponema sp.]|nr:hypothetical protein [Treponema sp.]